VHQELAQRHRIRVVAAPAEHVERCGRQVRGDRVVEPHLTSLDQAQHRGGDEGLGDAGDAKGRRRLERPAAGDIGSADRERQVQVGRVDRQGLAGTDGLRRRSRSSAARSRARAPSGAAPTDTTPTSVTSATPNSTATNRRPQAITSGRPGIGAS
jgi:hypothetical protein